MRILVLDGNENHAVACVRSLSRAGHRVEVGAATSWSKAGWSRFAQRSFQYPRPDEDPAGFVAAMSEEAGREAGTLVLPMTERTTLPISEQRATLAARGALLVLPAHDVVLRAFDKRETTALAESLGIPVPRTRIIASERDLQEFLHVAVFPIVLKASMSESPQPSGKIATTGAPRYARDARETVIAWREFARHAPTVLAQEFVEGSGAGYFALVQHGQVRAEFAHRRIRDVRPSGSGSAVRESVQPDSSAREHGSRILEGLRWHGVAMVEFRVRPDGTHVFLEVNGRFWNSLALAVYAGVDFPALLAEMAGTGRVTGPTSYPSGVRCRWLLGDARHLAAVLAGRPSGFAGAWPDKVSTLIEFFRPVRGTFHDNFTLDDPMPEVGDWVDFVFRKLPRALRKR